MKQVMALALSFVLTTGALALPAPQAGTTKSAKKKTSHSSTSAVAERLDKLQSTLDAQQQQIEQLKQDVQQRNAVIQQLQQQADQAKAAAGQADQKAETALTQSAEQQKFTTANHNDVADLKDTVTNTAQALQETQKSISESPIALRFKGITITPGGFMAAESVWRQHALGSDINTPFNSVTMPGAAGDRIE